jgi:hypothetical protein|tara:strand:+ start:550 stop:885 length:336 start_codon:yes stop_codon:yes gene_type:complete
MLPYTQPQDASGHLIDDVYPLSDYANCRVLASGTAEDLLVPAGAKFCTLTADGTFYFNMNGTAAKPTADITDGSSSRIGNASGTSLVVEAGENISVVADATRIVTATFWSE